MQQKDELTLSAAAELDPVRRRRTVLPVMLFVVTCLSTFLVGALGWDPTPLLSNPSQIALTTQQSHQGLLYMSSVIGILLFHEMGHFLQTVHHKVPASWPIFIPIPISPFGTMGAVIGMDGLRANRRQLFDIGISGPLAGLVLAIPITCIGIMRLDASVAPHSVASLHNPLLFDLLIPRLNPEFAAVSNGTIAMNQLNPFLMAGWVGLLVTGLNMLPVSQLDGGHVIYSLFRKKAHFVTGGFLIATMIYIVANDVYIWSTMLILVILIGVHHPPTADDQVSLGPVRWSIGVASLVIPILCFPPRGILTGF